MSKAWQAGLPDSDTLVIIRCESDETPVLEAYHDGNVWRESDHTTLFFPVVGWMNLETAAELLDSAAVNESKINVALQVAMVWLEEFNDNGRFDKVLADLKATLKGGMA